MPIMGAETLTPPACVNTGGPATYPMEVSDVADNTATPEPVKTVEPVYCGCGCGEITNGRQIEAWRLRGNGWRDAEIAERWGMTPGGVKAARIRQPGRFVKGHVAYARMITEAVEWKCERCGALGRVSTGQEIPRYCQRRDCLADHLGGFHADMRRYVEDRRVRRSEQWSQWFAHRRLENDLRSARRRRRTPEARRHAREAAQAYRDELLRSTDAWLDEQPDEIREFILDQRDLVNRWEVHLDTPLGESARRTLHDRIPHGFSIYEGAPRRDTTEWFDPVAEAAICNVEHELAHEEWELDPVVGL